MRKTLTLSKETLRILDDEDLARVVGGGGSDSNSDSHKKHGHGKTGKDSSCNAHHDKHKSKNSHCSNG